MDQTCIQGGSENSGDVEAQAAIVEGTHEWTRQGDASPLRRALRAHFDNYAGLTEPRIELASVALRPDRDDL